VTVVAAPFGSGRLRLLSERLVRVRSRTSSVGVGFWVAATVIVVIVLAALTAPILPLDNPDVGDFTQQYLSFGQHGHLLGTDGIGRDNLSRLIWGARPSLLSGITPVLGGGTIGTFLGVVAGLGSPRLRTLIMRTADLFYAFPALLLAIVIAATFGAGLLTEIVAIGVIIIPPVTRIAEQEASRVAVSDYVAVARSSGATRRSILFRQVLPNVAPALIVYCTGLVGLSISYAAGLSFLGLGIAAPQPEWGAMVNEFQTLILRSPFFALVPTVPIFAVAISFNTLGVGLRDLLAVEAAPR
jgi:peptide/nickel transport system permease protein